MLGFPLIVANDIENMRIEEADRKARLIWRCKQARMCERSTRPRLLARTLAAICGALRPGPNLSQDRRWNDVS